MLAATRVAVGFLSLLAAAASIRTAVQRRHAIVVGFGFPHLGKVEQDVEQDVDAEEHVETNCIPGVYHDIKLLTGALLKAGFQGDDIHLITDEPPSTQDLYDTDEPHEWEEAWLEPGEWNAMQRVQWPEKLSEKYGVQVHYVRSEGQYPKELASREQRAFFEFDNGAQVFWQVAFDVTSKLSDHDWLYLHVSSHGQKIDDNDGDELDGFDEVIYTPEITDQEGILSNYILDDDLYRWLTMLPDVYMLFVADTCYSGGISDLPYHYKPGKVEQARSGLTGRLYDTWQDERYWCLDRASMGNDEAHLPLADVLFLAASHSDQTTANVTLEQLEYDPNEATLTQAMVRTWLGARSQQSLYTRFKEMMMLWSKVEFKHVPYVAAFPTLASDDEAGDQYVDFDFSNFLKMGAEFSEAAVGSVGSAPGATIRAPGPCTGFGRNATAYPPDARLFSYDRDDPEEWPADDPPQPQGWVAEEAGAYSRHPRADETPRPIRRVFVGQGWPPSCLCCEMTTMAAGTRNCVPHKWGPPCAAGAPC